MHICYNVPTLAMLSSHFLVPLHPQTPSPTCIIPPWNFHESHNIFRAFLCTGPTCITHLMYSLCTPYQATWYLLPTHPCTPIPSLMGIQHGLGRVHGSAWSCMRGMLWYGLGKKGMFHRLGGVHRVAWEVPCRSGRVWVGGCSMGQ